MSEKIRIRDPDIIGSFPAMRRAAARARRIAKETGTPLVIVRDGKVKGLQFATAGPRKKRAKKRA